MPTETQSNTVTAPRPGLEFWDKICALPHYGFLLAPSGNRVVKVEDIGNWIDMHDAQRVVDQAQERINELRDELGAVKGEYDRAANKVDALQQRLNAADQRIDELTPGKGEQVALMPVERSYDVRAQQILAFNTSRQGDGDLDDALGAAYKAALRYTAHPNEFALIAEKLVKRLAEEFPDSETMLTVECVGDLITEYLTGL